MAGGPATAVMYSDFDIAVREIGGGVWFWTSLFLVIACAVYVHRETVIKGRGYRPVVWATAALIVYFSGSTIRGFLTWMQFFYIGNGWDASRWLKTWPWLGTSVILNIVGAALCVWYLSSWRWRLYFAATAVVVAIMVPVLLYVLV